MTTCESVSLFGLYKCFKDISDIFINHFNDTDHRSVIIMNDLDWHPYEGGYIIYSANVHLQTHYLEATLVPLDYFLVDVRSWKA